MERLQKVMAHAGIASRRKSEELIKTGRVKVNGEVVRELGIQVSNQDEIKVDNVPIDKEEPVYYLLNKPRSVISTVEDNKGRKTVREFFPQVEQRIYPIGRLDYDTTGAIILTNDGDFAQLLMHPKYEIEKTYVAKVRGLVKKETIKKLEKGLVIEGKKTSPAKARVISQDRKKEVTMVEIKIHEGRNHQVKNMFTAVGHPVLKLKRETYGQLNLAGLQPGESRVLKAFEIDSLKKEALKNS
ncbi:pseudouridine synthase [Lacticigenium naphthae]|uniref:pseudouridine synthase n=1 Tax=Lacticigenium naphthae TaxID=515351 RepID=UPI0004017803|nr:pseudouridine synthase [Lacticigenium naphthae]